MLSADRDTYLGDEILALSKAWPHNRGFTIVCHGHSIPCGYTAAHMVAPFDAYPHLLHRLLQRRFPTAVINVFVSAKGGENALAGAARFKRDVLSHTPDIVTIDYGANDLLSSQDTIEGAWRRMTEEALKAGVKPILITPAPDCGKPYYPPGERMFTHREHAAMLRRLAGEYGVALADASGAFAAALERGHKLEDYLISVNHLTRKGHALIARTIHEWFPFILPE
jgi:lysophospholipase L1-like esterase